MSDSTTRGSAAPRQHRWHEEPGGWSCACGVICDHEAAPCGRHGECKIGQRRNSVDTAAPFPDGWPTVPSLTVTRDGRVVLAAPLMGERQSFDVGPYRVWVTR